MKKISLKNLNLKEVEQLSREQLKDVLGGWTGGTGTEDETEKKPKCNCNNKNDCPDKNDEGKPLGCMADCAPKDEGYQGHCAWDGTSGD